LTVIAYCIKSRQLLTPLTVSSCLKKSKLRYKFNLLYSDGDIPVARRKLLIKADMELNPTA